MASLSNLFSILGYVFGLLFMFWPILLLAPLRWRSGNVLRGMFVMWVVMFFGWLTALLMFKKPIHFLIPEPLNRRYHTLAESDG